MRMKCLRSPVAVSVFLLITAYTATTTIIYGDIDAGDANDGSNLAGTYNYLRDGLSSAESGDEIRVAPAIYRYEVVDLGTLPGGTASSAACSINDSGQIVGGSLNSLGNYRATLFDESGGGNNIDLDTLADSTSYAYSINDSGQIVGRSRNSYDRATLFDPTGGGSNIDLGIMGRESSIAYSINNNGQIVGWGNNSFGNSCAVLFDPSGAGNNIELGTLGGSYASARAINNHGQIVGWSSQISGSGRATLFDISGNGNNINLGLLAGSVYSEAYSINDSGQIVGYCGDLSEHYFATLFDSSGSGNNIYLGSLGGSSSRAQSINNSGKIVGWAENSLGQRRACLFDPTGEGNNIDLNTLIAADNDWTLEYAMSINNHGWIVGNGTNPDGFGHAYLLKIAEPKTHYVDADAAGANNGSSWANAFNDLQDALVVAESGDEIRVAQGAYTPEGPLPDIRQASNPNPADGMLSVNTNADLSWTAGLGAASHDVYFGTSKPPPFIQNQTGTTFDPGTMAYSTVYYWRIDEVNDSVVTAGKIWSFTTMMSPPPLGSGSEDESIKPAADRSATFQLKNGVVIKGGYAGFGWPDPNARDMKVYETILTGDLFGNDEPNFVNYEENSYHVVTGSGCDETAVLDGFTITAGNANVSGNPTDDGGGIYNSGGSPELTNCTIIDNLATDDGGGIFNHNGDVTIKNCIFSRNSAGDAGGGIKNESCSPTLANCVFSGNSAEFGGGMYNRDWSSPTLFNCVFKENSATTGGGMRNYKSNPELTNCTFIGNSSYYGGGMGNSESSPTLTNCTIIDNLATDDGGGIFNNNGDVTIKNCVFSRNSAGDAGGGIKNESCSPTLANCVFSGNSAEFGGGMYNRDWSNPILFNCLFKENSATTGGGIRNYRSNPEMTNCILWGNTAPSGPQIHNYSGSSSATVSYSDVQGGWPGQGNINANPLFVDSAIGDYHLLPHSPCINAGDPNYVADPNETDLDGKPRVIAGRIDMGAYEFNHTPVADAGPDQAVEAQAPWGASVTLDGSGSSDDDSTPGTIDDINDFNWYELDPCDPNADVFLGSGVIIDCNLTIGEHIVLLEVIDKAGASDTNEVKIIVQDTTPPDINCPPNVTLECPADTSVEANGSATAVDTCGSVAIAHSDQWQPGCGNTGILTRTWTATDECGNSSSCVQTITVVDTTPPEFELLVSPTMLWPPDHKMYEITPSWTVSDKCDQTPDVSLVGIVANEGDNTIGDGHTTNDIQINEDGSIYLRSERSGTGNDRVYTITYQAVDDCGNTTVRSATVSIPHDFKVLARIASRWLWSGPAGRIPEDLNGDGFVNLADVARFAGNWTK